MKKLLMVVCLIVGMLICGNVCADLNDGLVAYYPFNGNANDESGNGYHGVVNGANLTVDRFNSPKSAYFFDNKSLINISDNSGINITAEFTITSWIYMTSIPEYDDYEIIFEKGHSWAFGIAFPGNKLYTAIHDNRWTEYFSSWSPTINTWHHVVVVRSINNTLQWYADGEKVGETSSDVTVPQINSEPVHIGSDPSASSHFFDGDIDEVRIYNRALSEFEIQQLYNEEETGLTEGGCSNEKVILQHEYLGACGHTQSTSFSLTEDAYITRIRIWYDPSVGGDALTADMSGPDGFIAASGLTESGGSYGGWREAFWNINQLLKAGSYTLTADSPSVCSNPSGDTTLILYGCDPADVVDDLTGLDAFENLIETEIIEIDYTEDEYSLIPIPSAFSGWDRIARLDNVMGDLLDEDIFAYSHLTVNESRVMITDIRFEGETFWMILDLFLTDSGVAYFITDFQSGWPSIIESGAALKGVDFSLSRADLVGPPLILRLAYVGIGDSMVGIDFVFNGERFDFTDIQSIGALHDLGEISLVSSALSPELSSSSFFNIEGAEFDDLFAFPFDSQMVGETYFNIPYLDGDMSQSFIVNDGWASGFYLGEADGVLTPLAFQKGRSQRIFGWGEPSEEESLDRAILKKARLNMTLGHDSKVSESLMNLATTMISELKLSSTIANKLKDFVMDNKDMIMELSTSGSTKPDTIIKAFMSDYLKNAPPAEHEKFIIDFFDGKVSEQVGAITNSIGNATEKNYKEAMAALTSGALDIAFPKTMAALKTYHETLKYLKDCLLDDIVSKLYASWKDNGDVVFDSKKGVALWAKINGLLRKRGVTIPEGDNGEHATEFLKTLFDNWKKNEAQLPEFKAHLEELKDYYLSLDEYYKNKLIADGLFSTPHGERFEKFVGLFDVIYSDLLIATSGCATPPSTRQLKDEAFDLLKTRWLAAGEDDDKRQFNYRKYRMMWLRDHGCIHRIVEKKIDTATLEKRLTQLSDLNLIGLLENLDGKSYLNCLCNRTAPMVNGGYYNGSGDSGCLGKGFCSSWGMLSCVDYDLTSGETALNECKVVEFIGQMLLENN